MQVLPRFRRLSTWPGPPGYVWYSEILHASLNVTSKLWGRCAGHDGGIDQRGGAPQEAHSTRELLRPVVGVLADGTPFYLRASRPRGERRAPR
jgi:hypothetical protein